MKSFGVEKRQMARLAPNKSNLLACAAKFGSDHSIAGGLHALGIGNNGGVAGFLTNTLGGNTLSGLTNLGMAVATGDDLSAQMGKAYLRGPLQGIPASFVGMSDSPLRYGLSGLARNTAVAAAYDAVAGGEALTTIAGEASLVANTGAEFATGVGEAKFLFDAGVYALGLATCAAGH